MPNSKRYCQSCRFELDKRGFSRHTLSVFHRKARLIRAAEYAAQGVEFTRGLANTPWHTREFAVKDCDGRLLAFGANL